NVQLIQTFQAPADHAYHSTSTRPGGGNLENLGGSPTSKDAYTPGEAGALVGHAYPLQGRALAASRAGAGRLGAAPPSTTAWWDASLPLRQAATPSIGLAATTTDRFATLDLWANRSCFFLWFHRGNTFYFQFVARQVGCLRGYRKFYTLATNTARAQGRGIK